MTRSASTRTTRPTPIRGRRSFEELRTHGVRARAKLISVTAAAPTTPVSGVRVSYAISSAVGGAVVRNRVRRRLRALVAARALGDGSYLIAASPRAASATFQELGEDLDVALGVVVRRLGAASAS